MKIKPIYIVENLLRNILINQWISVDAIFPNHNWSVSDNVHMPHLHGKCYRYMLAIV